MLLIRTLSIKLISFSQILPAIKHLLLFMNFSILVTRLFLFNVLITEVYLESPEICTFSNEFFQVFFLNYYPEHKKVNFLKLFEKPVSINLK
ncbi:MAG: hypothetical protein CM15mP102_09170 [Flavobacteriales bacterium]|nr:MAG: hypothetical protein CM15mP102_09170 [Flavobacteriales bacterium]